jgi:hypothetical protein
MIDRVSPIETAEKRPDGGYWWTLGYWMGRTLMYTQGRYHSRKEAQSNGI